MTATATCKNCLHFEEGDSVTGFGHCSRFHYGYTELVRNLSSNEILVEDDEGWGAIIGPEFGCVLFKWKPAK